MGMRTTSGIFGSQSILTTLIKTFQSNWCSKGKKPLIAKSLTVTTSIVPTGLKSGRQCLPAQVIGVRNVGSEIRCKCITRLTLLDTQNWKTCTCLFSCVTNATNHITIKQ